MIRYPSLSAALLSSTALATIAPAHSQSLPTGSSVVSGSVGFQRSSGTLTIRQSSQNAIVNYQSFSIGRRNTVDIDQPNASSAILNRVTGSTPSTIAGHLNANGQVYLVNPNGIAITKTGVVKVGGGFVASTLGMSDDEFKHGRKRFTGKGASAAVSNAGTVTIGRGGYAALIGGEVTNSGLISVPMGKVALGSGEAVTLDVSGDGFLQVAVPTASGRTGALVSNSGRISAAGGTVVLDAATARAAARAAVNISGTIDAHSISGRSGSILIGGGDGGAVAISGKLAVASRKGTGGNVTVTGQQIALTHAKITASGKTGGGTVKIGGDLHGQGTLAHAGTVTIDATSAIKADAKGQDGQGNGNGGSVVVWSDETTSFAGLISAKGGKRGGDGGNVEVSSHGVLQYSGTTNLLASNGKTGTLLLDPTNVVISTSTTSNETLSGGTYTPSGSSGSIIKNSDLVAALGSANVIVTTASAGSQAGTITVSSPVSWTAATTLSLNAASTIAVNAAITNTNGGLVLTSSGAGTNGNISSSSSGTINVGTLTINTVGTVSQSANITATNLLLQGGGTFSLTRTTNSIGTLAASNGTGNVSVGDGANLTIGTVGSVNGVTAGTLALSFSSAKGVASEAQPVNVTAMSLSGSGAGVHNLTNASNSIGTFAASVGTNGTISLTDSGALAIGTVGSTNGVTAGTLTLTDSGAVTQSQAISASKLALLGTGGGYTLTGSNSIGTLAANTGSVSLTDTGSLTIGTVGVTSGVTASGALTLNAGGTIGDPSAAVSAGTFNLNGRSWSQVGTLPTFSAANFVLGSGTTFLRATGGSGTTSAPYQIADIYGLQGIGTMLGGNFALANAIDASGTSGWNAGAGFAPIGTASFPCGGACFTGTFHGNGYAISNLSINSSGSFVGLFGASGGTISNVALTNANVAGQSDVGGLVGFNTGSIANASVSGAVTATSSDGGGLVGYNTSTGSITGSSSSATVSNINSFQIGGLAGASDGTIVNSSATGSVAGFQDVGGLIGANTGPVTNVYATGNVTGGGGEGHIGGLIGSNGSVNGSIIPGGTVTQAYATGTVTETNTAENPYYVGGLIGFDAGAIVRSFATGAVTGQAATGGLVGGQFGGSIANSYATGTVNGAIFVGGLVGESEYGGTIGSIYAANQVSGWGDVGGLVGGIGVGYGNGNTGATITSGYWNTDLGPMAGIGADNSGNAQTIQGQTTVQLQAALPTGFSNTVWGIVPSQTYPLLLTQPGVVSGTVEASYGGAAVGAGVMVSDTINGMGGTPTTTDTNGNYLFYLGANGIPSGTQVLVSTAGAGGGVSYLQNASGAASGLNIYDSYLSETTAGTTSSALGSGLTGAIGGNGALQTQVGGLTNRVIAATGSTFTIDQALTAGTLVLSTPGTITQSAAIAATNLDLQGAGGAFILANASNAVGTLAANAGSVSVTAPSLTVGTVAGTTGIATTGAVTLTTNTLSINQPISAPGQTVALQPLASNATLGLGAGSGSFSLPQATIGQITAGTLAFGSAASGTLTESGSLTVPSSIGALSLVTGGAINITGAISGSGLSLTAGTTISDSAAVNVGAFALQSGAWSQASASLPAFAASNFTLNGGTFLRVLGGAGTSGSPYQIADVYGLQGIDGFATNSDTFVLANNIDASGTSAWNAGAGFMPIGATSGFFGTLNGQHFAISNLTINLPSSQYVGLIGNFQSGTLQNLALTNANITGSSLVGGFAGYQSGGTFSNLTISGTVTGEGAYVGGILGSQSGIVQTSSSSANVTGNSQVGGLVGFNESVSTNSIYQSYATGSVTDVSPQSGYAGGLVGYNEGKISQSYATGAVYGLNGGSFGGLVGQNNSTITNSYATGAVTATFVAGGGGTSSVGGLVGYNAAGTITDTYATGLVTGDTSLPGGSNAGALFGTLQNGTVSASYWDTQTSGQPASVGYSAVSTSGLTAKTTMALEAALPTGFTNAIWGIVAGQTFPYLAFSPAIAISGMDYTTYGGTAVSGATVGGLVNGVANPYTATTNASGAYTLYLAPGMLAANSQLLVSTGSGATYDQNVSAAVSGLNIYGTYLNQTTAGTTLSGLNSGRAVAIGSNTGLSTQVSGLPNTLITATGASFTLDQAVAASGAFSVATTGMNAPLTLAAMLAAPGQTVTLVSSGSITEGTGGMITAGTLTGASAGAASFGQSGNAITNLGAFATSGNNLTLVDAVSSLGLTGAVNVGTGTLGLTNAGGGITEGAIATITAGTLTGASTGAAQFNATGNPTANTFGTLGPFSAGNAQLLVVDSSSFALAGAINAGSGGLSLNSTSGAVTQNAGSVVTAGALIANAQAGISLTGANQIATLTGITNGTPSSGSGSVFIADAQAVTLAYDAVDYRGSLTLTAPSLTISEPGQTLTIGSSGTTTVNGLVTLASAVSINGQTVVLPAGSTIDGGSALTLGGTLSNTVGAAIGGATPVASVTTSGPLVLGASVTTSGAQSYRYATVLTADATLTSTANGGVSFAGTLDSQSSGPARNLAVSTGGTASFGDVVGGITPLASLTTGGAGTTALNGGTVTTTGAQAYNETVALGAATVLTTSAGSITTGSTVDGPYDLTLDGTAVAINGAIGGTSPVTSLKATARNGNVTIAAVGSIRSSGAILIAANGNFINNNASGGASVLTPGGSTSYTIYTQDAVAPTSALPSDTFGGLTATNYYNDAYSFASGTFASAMPVGNHFVYGYAATLTPLLSGTVSKTYDGTTSASTAGLAIAPSGFVNANGFTDTATLTFTSAGYGDSNAGTAKGVTASGVSFLTNPNNYTLVSTTASATAAGTITAAPLGVSGLSGTPIVYANTTVDPLSGTAVLTGTTYGNAALTGTATGAFADANVGTGKAVALSGLSLTGTGASNYTLSLPTTLTADITPAPLGVSGLSGTPIVYGNTTVDPLSGTAVLTGTTYGNVGLTGTATGAFADANVGTGKAVALSGLSLTGPGASNYALSLPTTLTADITPAPLGVSGLSGTTIVYANTTVDPLSGTAVLTGTTYGNVALAGTATGAFADANVGIGKAVGLSGLSLTGPGASNYTLSLPTTLTADITPAPLTVSGTKVYDTTPGFATATLMVAGARNGETVRLAAGGGTSSSADVGAYAGSPLSNLALQVTGGNALASNYGLPSSGVLTITPATIMVVGAAGVDKTYDGTTALPPGASGVTASGIYGGDAAKVAVTAASAAYAKPDVGAEAVVVAGLALTGASAGDYVLAATGVTGSGTISPPASVSSAPSGSGAASDSGASPVSGTPSSASGLGSVLVRNLEAISGTPGDSPPLLFVPAAEAGASPASIVQGLSDPRFTASVVCAGTACTVVPRHGAL